MAQISYLCVRKIEPHLIVRKIVRVPVAYARSLIATGLWVITSKGAWKAAGRERMERRPKPLVGRQRDAQPRPKTPV